MWPLEFEAAPGALAADDFGEIAQVAPIGNSWNSGVAPEMAISKALVSKHVSCLNCHSAWCTD